MSNQKTISITRKQSLDINTCPACGSKEIDFEDSGCRCNCAGHSCWSHPVCLSCGYTQGSPSGNSSGGMWVAFGHERRYGKPPWSITFYPEE